MRRWKRWAPRTLGALVIRGSRDIPEDIQRTSMTEVKLLQILHREDSQSGGAEQGMQKPSETLRISGPDSGARGEKDWFLLPIGPI